MSLTFDNGKFLWIGGFDTKDIPKNAGFKWSPSLSSWWTESSDRAKKLVKYADAVATEAMADHAEKAVEVRKASVQASADYDAPCPAGLEYLPYQKAFLQFFSTVYGIRNGALLADEMGLGKTIQALGAINDHPDIRKILVVCPASLKLNWQREAEKWLVEKHEVKVLGTKVTKKINQTELPVGDRILAIVNYDILLKLRPILEKGSFDLIICDESHNLKNYKAKRTQSLLGGLLEEKGKESKTLLRALNTRFWLMMTGTPILNRPNELWTTVKKLDPTGLGESWKGFHFRYCGAKHTGFGWDVSGASNLSELQDKLRGSIMIRRLKSEVLKELPAKRRRIIPLEAQSTGTEEKLQDEASLNKKVEGLRAQIETKRELAKTLGKELDELPEEKAFVEALTASVGETIGEMSVLRKELAQTKARECLPLLVDAAETEPVLIFCHHHDTIDSVLAGLREKGIKAEKIDGRDPVEKRQKTVDAFQAGKYDALVLQIQAAGVGLTLTRSSHVIFLEQDWTPGRMVQAEDRAHRVGQANAVLVDYLVYDQSMDAHLAQVLIAKEGIISIAVDDTSTPTTAPEEAKENFLEEAKAKQEEHQNWLDKAKRDRAERLEKQTQELMGKASAVSEKMLFFMAIFDDREVLAPFEAIIGVAGGQKVFVEKRFDKVWVNGNQFEDGAAGFLKKFGSITKCYHLGKCCCCGRPLTDPVSIEKGIGPICEQSL